MSSSTNLAQPVIGFGNQVANIGFGLALSFLCSRSNSIVCRVWSNLKRMAVGQWRDSLEGSVRPMSAFHCSPPHPDDCQSLVR